MTYQPLTLQQYQTALRSFTPQQIIEFEQQRKVKSENLQPNIQPQPKLGFWGKVGKGIGEGLSNVGQAGIGTVKSIGSTIDQASQLGQRGIQTIANPILKAGRVPEQKIVKAPEVLTKPTTDMQTAGFIGGQIGQAFAIPNQAITQGATKVAQTAGTAMKLGKAAKYVQPVLTTGTKAIAEGGVGALGSKLAGGTDKQAKQAALLSGGLSVAGSMFSKVLQGSAEKSMTKALAPTGKVDKAITEKVVPGLVKRKVVSLTRGGLYEKAAQNADKADEALTQAYSALPEGTQSNWKPVLQELQNQKENTMVNGVVMDSGKYNALHKVQSDLLQVIGGKTGETAVSVNSARKARQILDKMVKNRTFGVTGAESDALMASKEAANAIRSQLAKEHPEIGIINKEFNFWKNVQDVVGHTIQRTKGQGSLTGEMATEAGAIAGGTMNKGLSGIIEGGIIGRTLKSALQSTAWRTASAATKSKLADFLANGEIAKATILLQRITSPQKTLPKKK